MVFKSKRQSRLTVATMFLSREKMLVQYSGEPEKTARVYSLQRRHNTTPRSVGTGGRSGSSGRHPVAVGGISPLLLAIHRSVRTLRIHRHVWVFIGRWGQITGTTGEGQRSGRREGPGLLRGGGMGRERIHCDVSRYSSCRPAKAEEMQKLSSSNLEGR